MCVISKGLCAAGHPLANTRRMPTCRARFSAIIAPENEPSLKLARKFGFAEVARTTYKDHPTIVLYREP